MFDHGDLTTIANNISKKIGYYCECTFFPQEKVIAVNAFYVPKTEEEKVQDLIYDYEDEHYDDLGYFLSAQIMTEENTLEYYSEKIQLAKEFALKMLIDSLVTKKFHSLTEKICDSEYIDDIVQRGNKKNKVDTIKFTNHNVLQSTKKSKAEEYALAA